jgi:hypothetical protein
MARDSFVFTMIRSAGVLALLIGNCAVGQQSAPVTASPPALTPAYVNELLTRIQELDARVKALEAKEASAAAPVQPPTAFREQGPLATGSAEHSMRNMAGMEPDTYEGPKLRIRGFADLGYSASDATGQTNSFALGQLNLFITSKLSPTFSVLAETIIEGNESNGIGIDLERYLLIYNPNAYLNLSIGRYHTGIGYYNTAYHHSAWMQTALERPFLFHFEDDGGILPIHNVGISAHGLIPSGKLGLHYIAEIGNGRTSRSKLAEAVQNEVDENNGKAYNLGFYVQPTWLRGVQSGVSVYRDMLHPDGLPKMQQTIVAAHVVYQTPRYEWLNEAMLIRNAAASGRTFNTGGGYTQISRQWGKYRPYLRYQYVNVPVSDPIFGDVGLRHGPSLGLRFDANNYTAFKLQYDRNASGTTPDTNAIGLQAAFTF